MITHTEQSGSGSNAAPASPPGILESESSRLTLGCRSQSKAIGDGDQSGFPGRSLKNASNSTPALLSGFGAGLLDRCMVSYVRRRVRKPRGDGFVRQLLD